VPTVPTSLTRTRFMDESINSRNGRTTMLG
jgi:hypothetical protein